MTPATPIDLAPLVNGVLIPLLTPALLSVLIWTGTRLAALFHIQFQDSQRQVLSDAVTNGIAYAQNVLGPHEVVSADAQVAAAVAYILPKVPGALKSLGVTPGHLADLVTAQLPPIAGARATAGALAAPRAPGSFPALTTVYTAVVDRLKAGRL